MGVGEEGIANCGVMGKRNKNFGMRQRDGDAESERGTEWVLIGMELINRLGGLKQLYIKDEKRTVVRVIKSTVVIVVTVFKGTVT